MVYYTQHRYSPSKEGVFVKKRATEPKEAAVKKPFRKKAILAGIMAGILLVALGAGAFVLSLQPDTTISDLTDPASKPVAGDTATDAPDDGKAQAVIAGNVTVFDETASAKINTAIQSVKPTNQGLFLEVKDGTSLGSVSNGDIFFLNGSEATPLGQPYFGKVVSVSDGGAVDTYWIETPMVDEVFDSLDFDCESALTGDNVEEIKTAEGVKAEVVDKLDPSLISSGAHGEFALTENDISTALGKPLTPTAQTVDKETAGGNLLFTFNIDLLRVFGLKKADEHENEEYSEAIANELKVYTTKTGSSYHRENCIYLHTSKSETNLTQATKDGLTACSVCRPGYLKTEDGDKSPIDKELTFSGKIGLSELKFNMDFEWDILSGKGIEELGVGLSGKSVVNASLDGNVKLELGGDDTEITVPFVKLQGLKEKLFPLAYIDFKTGLTPIMTYGDKDMLENVTTVSPLSIMAVLYVDIQGNITAGLNASFDYQQPFEYKFTLVEDGKLNTDPSDLEVGPPQVDWGIKAEISGDADVHAGASLMVYIFNLNIVDVGVVKFGAEAEGKLALAFGSKVLDNVEPWAEASLYARVYLKLIDFKLLLKSKLDFGFADLGTEFKLDFTLLDHTLKEWGEKRETFYDSDTMTYTNITATDQTALYYKDLDGSLVKEAKNGTRSVLYNEPFVVICAIDDSYVYLLRHVKGSEFEMVRVAKDGSTSKAVLDGIARVLSSDDEYIYYVGTFDESIAHRYNRETQQTEQFHDFDQDVVFVKEINDRNYYVVTQGFSIFYSNNRYYMLDKKGNILEDYGPDPEPENLRLTEYDDYYDATKMVGYGTMRYTAEDVYWLSPSKKVSVLTEHTTGWNPTEAGIFTTLRNDADGYSIVLYRAKDGQQVPVTTVSHDHAFFTLEQSPDGSWYYFDQADRELVLYNLSADFRTKTEIKRFSTEEINCNLSDCDTVLEGNRLYFYTMPSESRSTVLYRYDLY